MTDNTPSQRKGRCKQIKEKLKGTITFSLIFWSVIHLAMIVIGAINLHKCPVQENIPIFLISAGVIGMVSKLLGMVRHVEIKCLKISTILSIILTAELIYFIFGSYWVYKEYKPSYEPTDGPKYCDKTTYIFAITYISFVYGLMILAAIGVLCFACTLAVCEYACQKCMDNLLEDGQDASASAETRGTQTN